MTTVQPRTTSSTATAPPTEQSLSLVLDAETMVDADTGRLTLIASTDHNQSDLSEVTAAALRAMVDQARAKLDDILQLAADYEAHQAREALHAILAEHDVQLHETELPGRVNALSGVLDDGQRVILVPPGQAPVSRLRFAIAVLRDLGLM
ncbi:hypothetical protein [Streptomyces sp. NPDC020607]|uniref:hypothetical protein n=1 Tax=Streptomyces sp. NPDC020607 TaxID=3365082 RepID=UPI00379510C6